MELLSKFPHKVKQWQLSGMGLVGSSNHILPLPVTARLLDFFLTDTIHCVAFDFLFSFFLIYKFIYLFIFIFGCVGSLLLCVGFLWFWQVRATLHCIAWDSHCSGFSCCRAGALGTWASVVVARGLSSCGMRALEHSLSSCDARA